MKRVCVYAGSSPGVRPIYRSAAKALGWALAERGLELVYGGAAVGLMGAVADGVLEAGGKVTGVLTTLLSKREIAHPNLTELRIVDSMHPRKALMADLSDAFVALPGGLGSYEELFEVWTWASIGVHEKPVSLCNVEGFYDPLLTFLDHATTEGFVAPRVRAALIVEADPSVLLTRLETSRSPTRWPNQV